MKAIAKLKRKVFESFVLSFEGSEKHLTNYAIAVIIGIFGFYIFNLWIHNQTGYENFSLRLFAATLAFLLIIRSYWPVKFKSIIKWYWYFTLIYTLPFFFTFMLLHNSSSNIWQINGLIGFVVLALFVDWVAYTILAFLGVGAGLFAYYLTHNNGAPFIPPELNGVIMNYIAPIIYIMLFSTKREHIQNEKQQSLKMQAAAIAHEMRTPLSAITHMAKSLEKTLPTLITNQKIAQEKDENVPFFNTKELQFIQHIPSDLEQVTKSTFNVIDMLLINLQEELPETVLKKDLISFYVQHALHDYSLTSQEKKLISVDMVNDFEVVACPDLLKHVFFNLLKNSLHYIKAGQKGRILIWAEKGEYSNKLHFKDTGKGISKQILPYIFQQFYSKTDHGTGVGLAFCKAVMQQIGGGITCESVEGEFTHFTLIFPLVKN